MRATKGNGARVTGPISAIAWRFPCDQRVRCLKSPRSEGSPCWSTVARSYCRALPAGGEQAQPEILVLGERVSPGNFGVGDVVERAESVELAATTHSGGPPVVATRLVEVAVDGELDVVEPVQKPVAVVDADQ
jgi:hypothetical protein